MLRRILAAVVLMMLAVLPACQVKDEVWINPDGSGKVVHAVVGGDAASARSTLEGFMSSSGLDVLTDPAIKTANNETTVSVTGYFKDFNKVSIGQTRMSARPEITVAADGTITLKFNLAGPDRGPAPGAGSQPAPTAEQIDAEVKNAQTQINQQLNGGTFGDMMQGSQTYVFHFPAAVKSNTGFKAVDAQTLTLVLEGKKVKEALTKLAADTATLRKMVEASPGGRFRMESPVAANWLGKELFGTDQALTAVVPAGGKAAFDYKAEVAKAKPLSAQSMLDSGALPKDPPAGTMKFTEFKLTNANTSSSFGQTRTFFNFEGKLAAGVSVLPLDTEYYVVIDDKGNYYVPGGKATRTQTFGSAQVGNSVKPFISMPVAEGAKKLARVAGVVNVATYTSVKDVDLGVLDIKTGAKGSQYGFKFTSVQSSGTGNNASAMLSAEMDATPGLGEIKFIDPAVAYPPAAGAPPAAPLFSFGGNSSKRSSMVGGRPLPEKARAVITVYEGYKTQQIPFELKDVDVPPPPAPASAPGTRP